MKEKFKSYWSQTGTYEAVVPLINMDFDGLRTSVIEMLSGNAPRLIYHLFRMMRLILQIRTIY